MSVQVDGMRVPLWVYVWVRGMVTVPLVEMSMQYISALSETWMLVVIVGELEGWERKYEPSGNFFRVV